MFGWIHESFRQLIVRKYGNESWLKILEIAKFDEGDENCINKNYSDEETYRLANAVSTVVGIPTDEVWEAYGGFLIQFTMETGWDELLRSMANDLKGFLDNLDSLHYFIDHVVYRTRLKGPSFRCDSNADGSLTLHYFSKRTGLYPIVRGVIREVGRQIFGIEVSLRVVERKLEHIEAGGKTRVEEHTVFKISEIKKEEAPHQSSSLMGTGATDMNTIWMDQQICVNLKDFCTSFPYHICFNPDLRIEHCGMYLRKVFPMLVLGQSKLTDLFEILHPEIDSTFDNFLNFINGIFVFKLHSRVEDVIKSNQDVEIRIKGQMILLESGQMILLCSPYMTTIRELLNNGLYLADIPAHDLTRDMILLNQSRMSQIEISKRLEETTQELKKLADELDSEKSRTEQLLQELLPSSVAQQLRSGQPVNAGEFPEASIAFADIVTFTNICAHCKPIQVVQLLDDLYLRFDRLTQLNEVYKVETIGDAYVVVGGVPEEAVDHAEKTCNMAIGMIWESKYVKSPISNQSIEIRIGIHTGPVVAGVVGRKMPRYCLFGETVNIANRLENQGTPNRIHISATTYKSAVSNKSVLQVEQHGWVNIKEKGDLFTYFLLKNERKSVWEIVDRRKAPENSIDGYSELHDSGGGATNSSSMVAGVLQPPPQPIRARGQTPTSMAPPSQQQSRGRGRGRLPPLQHHNYELEWAAGARHGGHRLKATGEDEEEEEEEQEKEEEEQLEEAIGSSSKMQQLLRRFMGGKKSLRGSGRNGAVKESTTCSVM